MSGDHEPGAYREFVRSASDLQGKVFPPLRWAVPNLIPEGLTLLVGAPKVGKSWAALDVGLSVASGGLALGALAVDEGDVLYLALEDSERRLQDRISLLLGGSPFPERFAYATRWPKSTLGATFAHEWATDAAHPRLIVVDTLARIRGPQGRGSAYDEDTATMVPWQRLAERWRCAVVLVHHDRKASVDDFIDAVSGTHGLAGVADSTLLLDRARMEDYGRLRVTGRDVLEHEVALRRAGPAWIMHDGPLPDDNLGDTSAGIVALAGSKPDGIRAADVVDHLNVSDDVARRYLARLAESGRLLKRDRGLYVGAVSSVPSVPSQEHSLSTPNETHETHETPTERRAS